MVGKILTALAFAYLLAGIVSLWFVPASAYGWLGVEPDPLAGIFALILSLPWSLALRLLAEPGPVLAGIGCAIGIAINFALLLWLARL